MGDPERAGKGDYLVQVAAVPVTGGELVLHVTDGELAVEEEIRLESERGAHGPDAAPLDRPSRRQMLAQDTTEAVLDHEGRRDEERPSGDLAGFGEPSVVPEDVACEGEGVGVVASAPIEGDELVERAE